MDGFVICICRTDAAISEKDLKCGINASFRGLKQPVIKNFRRLRLPFPAPKDSARLLSCAVFWSGKRGELHRTIEREEKRELIKVSVRPPQAAQAAGVVLPFPASQLCADCEHLRERKYYAFNAGCSSSQKKYCVFFWEPLSARFCPALLFWSGKRGELHRTTEREEKRE